MSVVEATPKYRVGETWSALDIRLRWHVLGLVGHRSTTYGALRDFVEQEIFGDEAPATLATDLLGATLSEVNWRELAEAKLAEVAEDQS